jgi:hypothetical protein
MYDEIYREIYRVLKTAPDNDWYDWCADFDGFPEPDKQYIAECFSAWKDKSDKEKCDLLILLMNRHGEEMLITPVDKTA